MSIASIHFSECPDTVAWHSGTLFCATSFTLRTRLSQSWRNAIVCHIQKHIRCLLARVLDLLGVFLTFPKGYFVQRRSAPSGRVCIMDNCAWELRDGIIIIVRRRHDTRCTTSTRPPRSSPVLRILARGRVSTQTDLRFIVLKNARCNRKSLSLTLTFSTFQNNSFPSQLRTSASSGEFLGLLHGVLNVSVDVHLLQIRRSLPAVTTLSIICYRRQDRISVTVFALWMLNPCTFPSWPPAHLGAASALCQPTVLVARVRSGHIAPKFMLHRKVLVSKLLSPQLTQHQLFETW